MEKENIISKTLLQWQLKEEKPEYHRDKIILVLVIGIIGSLISILLQTYIFALLLIIATFFFIHNGKSPSKILTFKITNIGIFLNTDFIGKEEIDSFNIIDKPGARAQLIIKVKKIITINEIIPIYDVQINEVRDTLKSIKIKNNKNINLTLIDKLNTII